MEFLIQLQFLPTLCLMNKCRKAEVASHVSMLGNLGSIQTFFIEHVRHHERIGCTLIFHQGLDGVDVLLCNSKSLGLNILQLEVH